MKNKFDYLSDEDLDKLDKEIGVIKAKDFIVACGFKYNIIHILLKDHLDSYLRCDDDLVRREFPDKKEMNKFVYDGWKLIGGNNKNLALPKWYKNLTPGKIFLKLLTDLIVVCCTILGFIDIIKFIMRLL